MTLMQAALPGEPRTRHFGRGHIPALDGLRGLAVLGVMASHFLVGDAGKLTRYIALPLSLGPAGVDVFFVLSGFLITGILRDSVEDSAYYRKFYGRRVLRIFPLYYGVLLLLILLAGPLGIAWHGMQWSLLLYLQNTHWISAPLNEFHTPYFSVDHFWSLAVEEQFYLVWPLAVWLVRPARYLIALCGLGVVTSFLLRWYALGHGFGYDWTNRNTLCRTDELLAGAALAVLLRSRYVETVVSSGKPMLVVGLTAFLCERGFALWTAPVDGSVLISPLLMTVQFTTLLIAAAGVLLCCLRPMSRLSHFFQSKLLRWFGKYSYGLYVIHLILFQSMTYIMLNRLRGFLHNKLAARMVLAIAVFAISCGAAFISYQMYEKRFLRLKRFFDYDRPPAQPHGIGPSPSVMDT